MNNDFFLRAQQQTPQGVPIRNLRQARVSAAYMGTKSCPRNTRRSGLITLGEKPTGKPSARNSHAGFDVAGTGNQLRSNGASSRPYRHEHLIQLARTECELRINILVAGVAAQQVRRTLQCQIARYRQRMN